MKNWIMMILIVAFALPACAANTPLSTYIDGLPVVITSNSTDKILLDQAGTLKTISVSNLGPVDILTAQTIGGVKTFSSPIVGSLTGNATTATTTSGNATTSTNATTHIADVTGTVHGAVTTNTANMIVSRDASGGFAAGTITANLTGNVTGNTSGSSGSCTGNSNTATTATNAANATSLSGKTWVAVASGSQSVGASNAYVDISLRLGGSHRYYRISVWSANGVVDYYNESNTYTNNLKAWINRSVSTGIYDQLRLLNKGGSTATFQYEVFAWE